ncbi:portal vertex of the head [Synechococcus phage S-CAM9]|uniref:Portal protein n=2 Tax=Viruses TaxID=10239 RepID=A0A1D8KNK9_9CAUD|nr:portal protein [Synechococcus phage S-CAM9]AOV60254.1 portal vertex of the head [Synechococcus phage S-CAM9]AOV60480.1 portal vertex of the head [Synechococcus phage S-CAM9]AOV60710.1 portal vertex of the head [Synechococcus phage S-CAM9]
MAGRLFGFSIQGANGDNLPPSAVTPVPQNEADASDYYVSSGFYGQYVDIEGVFRNEYDLIKRYREMSLHPECDEAIEDIVNEAIVSDLNDSPVEIDLSNLQVSDNIKKVIRAEFKYIKDLLDFDSKAHELFRNWYVDGRLYYHKVIDLKNPQAGIQELRFIDALKIKYVRKQKKEDNNINSPIVRNANDILSKTPIIEEYFEYNPNSGKSGQGYLPTPAGTKQGAVRIAKDAITYCTSGLVDRNKHTTLSWLHKGIKALNQLRMIEDALVIYRLSRAPERRIFYIDVGNLPKVKAEQYLREVMNRYRSKLVYDANTGEVRDDKKFMSMLEDFWLPRREGGRGTEISTLPGGQNLGEITDIQYFQKKLYKALGVPETRLGGEDGFNLGRSSEILRDELRFNKFVGRLRKRFSNMFLDMLKTQLLLKNVIAAEDWPHVAEHIQFDYIYDNHFAELKEAELFQNRMGNLAQAEPYIGKYFSQDYLRRKILRQTDDEIVEQDKLIAAEIEAGLYMDPAAAQVMDMAQQAADIQSTEAQTAATLDPQAGGEQETAAPEGGEI